MRQDYSLRISNEPLDPAWDAFVAQVPGGHHVQTSLWGIVKASLGWRALRVIANDGECIVAGAQLLIRPLPLLGSIAYITKGPLCAYDNPQLSQLVLARVLQVSRTYQVQLLAIQPPSNSQALHAHLSVMGFRPSALELAPTASVLLDLSPALDCILSRMKRQTRQNIKRSEREEMTTREGTEADLSAFYDLHEATSRRQGFLPYPKEYFQQMWRVLKPRGYVELIVAEYRREPVSALLIVPFGDTVIAKILGWSGLHGEKRPNDAVFWGSIQWSKAHGYRYFDFEGIDRAGATTVLKGESLPDSLQKSPDFFKLGYGGQVVLYPEAYEWIGNRILRWAYTRVRPKVGTMSVSSRLLDQLRKR